MMLKWGFDLMSGSADYDYYRADFVWVPNLTDPQGPDFWPRRDTLRVAVSRSGAQAGAYLATRFRPSDALTVEPGLRFDHQSYTAEHQISPRIQAALQLTPATTLRGAWGYYSQPQALNELSAADADTTFYPAQRAEHRVLAVDRRFGSGLTVRIEAYERLLSNPLPEYRRVSRNTGPLWEESLVDRIFVQPERGRAEGVELLVKSPAGRSLTWSGSYALSKVEEEISGEWVPRPFDQRHAVNLQVAFRPTSEWSFAAGWIYHSPWPFTEVKYRLEQTVGGEPVAFRYTDVLNQKRLPPYMRLDLRVSREFKVNRGDLLVYADVFNALMRDNALDMQQSARWVHGRWKFQESVYPQMPMLPSVGARWTF